MKDKKYSDKSSVKKSVPKGYHKMPDGKIMKGSQHKTKKKY